MSAGGAGLDICNDFAFEWPRICVSALVMRQYPDHSWGSAKPDSGGKAEALHPMLKGLIQRCLWMPTFQHVRLPATVEAEQAISVGISRRVP